jgi:hypothetical protein
LPSLQVMLVPPQLPPEHPSLIVHALPSSHVLLLNGYTHPVPALHVGASVQGLPSSGHTTGVPAQTPPAQTSFSVQSVPSLQGAVLSTTTQPVAGSHESSVQTSPSSHVSVPAPAWQRPPKQTSPRVHASASSHGSLSVVDESKTQPVAGSQLSRVQLSLSSQTMTVPPQLPPPQTSLAVQALPSSQGTVFGVCSHPPGPQLSSVHGLPSSQPPTPAHAPAVHTSLVVQASPSSQGVPFGRFGLLQRPVPVLHVPAEWH